MNKSSKKYYSAPSMETVCLDQSIVVQFFSVINPPSSAAPVEPDKPSFGPSSVPPSSTSNPFGGNKPDYSDM